MCMPAAWRKFCGFKFSASRLYLSTWTIWEQQSCTQKSWLQVAKYSESYTVFVSQVIRTYCSQCSVVKVSRRESGDSGDLGLIPAGCWNSLPSLGHSFCMAVSLSVYWHAHFFYCCALSLFIFFLGFLSSDLALTKLLTLTLPSNLHCFEELKLGPWPALAHKCWPGTWAEIIAIVEPQSWLKGFVFSWFFEEEKTKAS